MPNPITDANYRPIASTVYDPIGVQTVFLQAGPTQTGTDGTVYAPQRMLPFAGTQITASATSLAAAQCQATLAAVAGKTTYITGFVVTSSNPGATVAGTITITGTITGTLNFQFVESATLGGEIVVMLPTPISASAANTAIVVTLPAITGGGTGAVSAFGFQI